MGYAQAAIKCIVKTSPKQSYKPTHRGFAVFGILYSQANQPSLQATGERVGAEKIAERRVATKASQTSQSSPRVFSEIFCSTHPERGVRQPTVQVPPASNTSQPTMQAPPQSETLTSQLGKFLKRNMSQPAVQVYFHCGGCIQPRHRDEPVSCDGCFLHPPGVMSEDAEK